MTVGPAKVRACMFVLFTKLSLHYICSVFRGEDKKIISQICQICQIGSDCDQNGDRMSKNDEK